MAWYPEAARLELRPESTQQSAIRPTQLILHSVVAPWDEHRIYAYWRDSTSLESHFGLDFDGSLGQYLPTTIRADANASANRRPDGTGAVSIETASNLQSTDPWRDDQLDALADLGVWLHRTHGIPLRKCSTPSSPGIGYHKMHLSWSTRGTACPGTTRTAQFGELLAEMQKRAGKKPTPAPAGKPVVSLAHIRAAQTRDPGLAQGAATYRKEGLVVETALYKEGVLAKRWADGSLGTRTRLAVSDWQERLGYRGRKPGQPADGIFGRDSLTRLGHRHGFTVTS
ncbi:N-acetylmuramoyl-L-alanine amidase [Streptomyces uncialis]|uniref:peptidoglycan recognition protein family protein n=1 Tax=Streptomyces uncialis TaxID=1048205 RepID=UPI00364ACF34